MSQPSRRTKQFSCCPARQPVSDRILHFGCEGQAGLQQEGAAQPAPRTWENRGHYLCCRSIRRQLVAADDILQLTAHHGQLLRGALHLAHAVDVLGAGIFDTLNGGDHLIHAHQLLLARSGNLGHGLGCFGDARGQLADRATGFDRL